MRFASRYRLVQPQARFAPKVRGEAVQHERRGESEVGPPADEGRCHPGPNLALPKMARTHWGGCSHSLLRVLCFT